MAILQIENDAYLEMLSRFPEAAMGYHLVEVRDTVAIAVGGYMVFELTPQLVEELESLLSEQWLRPDADLTIKQRQEGFRAWLRGLRSAGFPRGVPASRADIMAAIVVETTSGSPPPPPQPPPMFTGIYLSPP